MTTNLDTLLTRALNAILDCEDYTDIYEGQALIEQWAIDALRLAAIDDPGAQSDALALLDKYQGCPWSRDGGDPGPYRIGYRTYGPSDDEERCDWCGDVDDLADQLCSLCAEVREKHRTSAS